jgi:nitronate monooxygenase
VLSAQAMSADFAYIGTAFIAKEEAHASAEYKQAIVPGNSDDIVYTKLFTGVHGNYLTPSILATGMDPANLPEGDLKTIDFSGDGSKAKTWKDIWGSGQGIGTVTEVTTAAAFVEQLKREYAQARRRLERSWHPGSEVMA